MLFAIIITVYVETAILCGCCECPARLTYSKRPLLLIEMQFSLPSGGHTARRMSPA